MQCEMCGSESLLFKTLIEGTELNLCNECSKYGKIVRKIKEPQEIKKQEKIEKKRALIQEAKESEPETITIVVDNYSELIKSARERKGLTQKQLAKALSQKESMIHNLESGRFKPSIELAKRFERYLRIKILEEIEDKAENPKKVAGEALTIGDMLVRKNLCRLPGIGVSDKNVHSKGLMNSLEMMLLASSSIFIYSTPSCGMVWSPQVKMSHTAMPFSGQVWMLMWLSASMATQVTP